MAALDFPPNTAHPAAPTVGEKWPQPPVPGQPVYTWDGEKWTTLGGTIDSGGASNALPLMNGAAVAGVSTKYTREDHVHPTDASIANKVAKAGDTMTGHLSLPITPAADNAVRKDYVDAIVPNANVVINGDFRVNQVGYVSAAVLAVGAYGHDQWKAGASGGDYSFTQLKSSTQITIASGKSLIQPIEDVNVVGGSYVLKWAGTAQARAGVNTLTPSGSYAASPLLIAGQTAGTVMSIEFNNGTLGTVKLESGSIATPFVMPDYASALAACQRYWYLLAVEIYVTHYIATASSAYTISFPEMRAVPAATIVTNGASGGGSISAITCVPNASRKAARILATTSAVGESAWNGRTFSLNARL